MARTLTLRVRAEIDGRPIRGFPLVRTLVVAELQRFDLQRASDGLFRPVPEEEVDEVHTLAILKPTQSCTVRLAGQSTAGVVIQPGGLLLLFNGKLCGSPTVKPVLLQNDSGETLRAQGLVAFAPQEAA